MRKYHLSEKQRAFSYQEDGAKKSALLRQIIAVSDFNGVIAGSAGDWIDREAVSVQERNYRIYDQNTIAFGGTVISGNTHTTGINVLWGEVCIADNIWTDNSKISQGICISSNVTTRNSLARDQCRIFGHALIDQHSMVATAQDLTSEHQLLSQIYDRARANASRIVHQAQICGGAVAQYIFIEHRARVFDFADAEGDEENNVWLYDCVKVCDHVQAKVGVEEDVISMTHYSSQATEYVIVGGNRALRHHILIGGNAVVRGGPILLNEYVIMQGESCITGVVIIENHMELTDHAAVEAFDGDTAHICSPKVINGEKCTIRTLLVGLL